jgi:hypothetical protein
MRRAAAAAGIFALMGCVRGSETIVRERAATDFACADYALHVEEVGPDVYRASGCGQELIYACRPVTRGRRARAQAPAGDDAEGDDFADTAAEATTVCARRPAR